MTEHRETVTTPMLVVNRTALDGMVADRMPGMFDPAIPDVDELVRRAVLSLRTHGVDDVAGDRVVTGPDRLPIVLKSEIFSSVGVSPPWRNGQSTGTPNPPIRIGNNASASAATRVPTEAEIEADRIDALGPAHLPNPPLAHRDDLADMILNCLERTVASRDDVIRAERILAAVAAFLHNPLDRIIMRTRTPWRGPDATGVPDADPRIATGLLVPRASECIDVPIDEELSRLVPDVVTVDAESGGLVLRSLPWASTRASNVPDGAGGFRREMQDVTPDVVSAMRTLEQRRRELDGRGDATDAER